MVALYFMHYNFCRIHETIGVTPAMEAEVTTTLWDESDIVDLIDQVTPAPGPRGPYNTAQKRRENGEMTPLDVLQMLADAEKDMVDVEDDLV